MKGGPDIKSQIFHIRYPLSFGTGAILHLSLRYHELAKWLFIILAFAGLLSTGWFGIPLVPSYFLSKQTNIMFAIFTLFSALGTIWGVMAYREFSRSIFSILEAREAARKLDPMIGEYEYRSYDPATREYESGFIPSGAIDFWDKETHVPTWMDKGKYWHVLLSLGAGRRDDVKLQVVKDSELPFFGGRGNAALTVRRKMVGENETWRQYQYIVRIPQWIVMNTERQRFTGGGQMQGFSESELSEQIARLNASIVAASDEIADWERLRIRYPWKIMNLGLYLNKSLPLRIVYGQVIRNFPGAKRRKITDANANLANIKDDELESTLLLLAADKGVKQERLERIQILLRFLKNEYTKHGLGVGASEYHSFHHSLEVSYMALHMLPKSFQFYSFEPRDFELMLVASLLHDYDPGQATFSSGNPTERKGPSVTRTMKELERTKILEAYFTLNLDQFANFFQDYTSRSSIEFSTTNPEVIPQDIIKPVDAVIVELLIWRTDFPFFKQKLAQEVFASLLTQLVARGVDPDRTKLLAEILWLADLAVTYMGSDPVRAWDRVTNLYDELNLPKLEAVSRTDAFFGDFATNEIFQQIIKMRHFPAVFRQRWELIFNFFHEGNPSTQINRTLQNARRLYNKVNIELGLRRGELLEVIASNHFFEYFIGIGRDQREVFKAKSRFSAMDPQNASAFWGDTEKLLPGVLDKSIDNILIVMPAHSAPLFSEEQRETFSSTLTVAKRKLNAGGAIRILTDLQPGEQALEDLEKVADRAGFYVSYDSGKRYFPDEWVDSEFRPSTVPRLIVLSAK